jgi:fructose-bisphosphate aldolase / 6-deoxy-5-ketofructose 1-phosphate synthase
MANEKITPPLSVPSEQRKTYEKNYSIATHHTKNLFIFAGDQKIEHLNDDFFGENIPQENGDPEHLFKIAQKGTIGTFATQLGLIARYGMDYQDIPYTVKLNSKTSLPTGDPISRTLHSVHDVIAFNKHANLNIVGIGYTIYLGSKYESIMLQEAAQHIFHAHQHGLLSILWIYPRGGAVQDERSPDIIAGAAGVGASLGADFIKVNPPKGDEAKESASFLKQATLAAGRSGIICSGGSKQEPDSIISDIHKNIAIGGARGCAIGRNIHQLPMGKAIELCDRIAAIVYEGKNP